MPKEKTVNCFRDKSGDCAKKPEKSFYLNPCYSNSKHPSKYVVHLYSIFLGDVHGQFSDLIKLF